MEYLIVAGSEELLRHQRDHAVRSRTRVKGPVTLPEAKESLLHVDLLDTINKATVGEATCFGIDAHVHHSHLNRVEWKRRK